MELLKEKNGCIGEKAFHGEKECFFQPFYNVEKKQIWGAEALFRLKDENGNYYNMDELAAKAEEEGWISEIDKWVFREACKRIPSLRTYGLKRININLSPEVCVVPETVPDIMQVLKQYDVSRSEVCMEITEMCRVRDAQSFSRMVEHLNRQGIRLALDDFGKGESNLLRLTQIPFQTLKIDKEMVWGTDGSKIAEDLVEGMIRIAHRHNIQVTAEGIETLDQARTLASWGCDYLQGYLIAPPLSYGKLLAFLKENGKKNFLEE